MAKLNLITLQTADVNQLNANFSSIEDEFQNKVLYRDNPMGEPNQMMNDIDMNSNDILNASSVNTNSLFIGGSPVVDAVIAQDASAVTYDNTTSGLAATDVQAAIDEVEGRVDTLEPTVATNTSNISTNTTNITNLESDTPELGTAVFSSDEYTFTPLSGSFKTLAAGQVVEFDLPAGSVNTTTTPRIIYNGQSNVIQWIDGTALIANDLEEAYTKRVRFKFTGTNWLIISSVSGEGTAPNVRWRRDPCGWQEEVFFDTLVGEPINVATGQVFFDGGLNYSVLWKHPFSNSQYNFNVNHSTLNNIGFSILSKSNTSAGWRWVCATSQTSNSPYTVAASGRWY